MDVGMTDHAKVERLLGAAECSLAAMSTDTRPVYRFTSVDPQDSSAIVVWEVSGSNDTISGMSRLQLGDLFP